MAIILNDFGGNVSPRKQEFVLELVDLVEKYNIDNILFVTDIDGKVNVDSLQFANQEISRFSLFKEIATSVKNLINDFVKTKLN